MALPPLSDIIDDDLGQGVELLVLALFFGAIAVSSVYLAYKRSRTPTYTEAGLDRLLAALDADALSDHLLDEAQIGGSQENWTLAERQVYYVAHHPLLWEQRLPRSRHTHLSVPESEMNKHFPTTMKEDIPKKEG